MRGQAAAAAGHDPNVASGDDRLTDITFLVPVDAWWPCVPCASWRTRNADRYTGPWNASTPNPILVIGNRNDPRAAYGNAQRAARRLGNAVLLTLNGYGHTSDSDHSDCIDRAVRRYLVTTTPPPDGTVCQADRQPFDPDFGQPLQTRTMSAQQLRIGFENGA